MSCINLFFLITSIVGGNIVYVIIMRTAKLIVFGKARNKPREEL